MRNLAEVKWLMSAELMLGRGGLTADLLQIFASDTGGREVAYLRVADAGSLAKFLSPLFLSSVGTRDI